MGFRGGFITTFIVVASFCAPALEASVFTRFCARAIGVLSFHSPSGAKTGVPYLAEVSKIRDFQKNLGPHQVGLWRLGRQAWIIASRDKTIVASAHPDKDMRELNGGLKFRQFDSRRSFWEQIEGRNAFGLVYRNLWGILPGRVFDVPASEWEMVSRAFGFGKNAIPTETLEFEGGLPQFFKRFNKHNTILTSPSYTRRQLALMALLILGFDQGLFWFGNHSVYSSYFEGRVTPLSGLVVRPIEDRYISASTSPYISLHPFVEFARGKPVDLPSFALPATFNRTYKPVTHSELEVGEWMAEWKPRLPSLFSSDLGNDLRDMELFFEDPDRISLFLEDLHRYIKNQEYTAQPDWPPGAGTVKFLRDDWGYYGLTYVPLYYYPNQILRYIFPQGQWERDGRRRLPSAFVSQCLKVIAEKHRKAFAMWELKVLAETDDFERFAFVNKNELKVRFHFWGGLLMATADDLEHGNLFPRLERERADYVRDPLMDQLLRRNYEMGRSAFLKEPTETLGREIRSISAFAGQAQTESLMPYLFSDSQNPAFSKATQYKMLVALSKSANADVYRDYLRGRVTLMRGDLATDWLAVDAFIELIRIFPESESAVWIEEAIRSAPPGNQCILQIIYKHSALINRNPKALDVAIDYVEGLRPLRNKEDSTVQMLWVVVAMKLDSPRMDVMFKTEVHELLSSIRGDMLNGAHATTGFWIFSATFPYLSVAEIQELSQAAASEWASLTAGEEAIHRDGLYYLNRYAADEIQGRD